MAMVRTSSASVTLSLSLSLAHSLSLSPLVSRADMEPSWTFSGRLGGNLKRYYYWANLDAISAALEAVLGHLGRRGSHRGAIWSRKQSSLELPRLELFGWPAGSVEAPGGFFLGENSNQTYDWIPPALWVRVIQGGFFFFSNPARCSKRPQYRSRTAPRGLRDLQGAPQEAKLFPNPKEKH